MGIYLNPGNQAFKRISGADYVDKTGLINMVNERIGGDKCLICISRPRRFGKTYAAKMLTAYYDRSCDSHMLFDDKQIAKTELYEKHMNQYNVICLDISGFLSDVKKRKDSLISIPVLIEKAIWKDLVEIGFTPAEDDTLNDFLIRCAEAPDGKPFIFIIDEWDALIRESEAGFDVQDAYLNLLRGWFKNTNFTPRVVAAAYMTGILPIKKDGSQSAISEFDEYSMLDPLEFAEYVGFTESEVKDCCLGKSVSFEEIREWYDGYDFDGAGAVYNPYSVMKALRDGKCRSYWKKTSAAESLINYINMDFEGLQSIVARLITGESVHVNVDSFQNDYNSFGCADDVLTLLIHLGYLVYHENSRVVSIPNEEVREEFRHLLSGNRANSNWMTLINRSKKLFEDTIACRSEAVASALEEIRGEQYAPQYYNNEQSLRAIIKYAYICLFGQYVKVEEMPSGKGIADIVFLPSGLSNLPAMVIELKWNKTSGGAISQIHEKKYSSILKPYAGNLLLVGINYDEKSGKHFCEIEKE